MGRPHPEPAARKYVVPFRGRVVADLQARARDGGRTAAILLRARHSDGRAVNGQGSVFQAGAVADSSEASPNGKLRATAPGPFTTYHQTVNVSDQRSAHRRACTNAHYDCY